MKQIKYIATSPEGEIVLIDNFSKFCKEMEWKKHSAYECLRTAGYYKGWELSYYQPIGENGESKESPEIILDSEKYYTLTTAQFVFRPYTINGLSLSWEAYIYPELEKPAATDIVEDPISGGYKWNCYNGCEGTTRAEVARKIMATLDPETI